MTHGALRLSAIALGAGVVALLTPVAPATPEVRPHGSHGFAGPAVHGHGFHPRGPAFHHGFAGGGVHRPAMRVVHGAGRYSLSGGRAYTHAHHYGYAYGHRYGRHGYPYRDYVGGYYAGGYSYPYAGGHYHRHHRYYAGGYYYRHHHGCWWYRHYDPYEMPSWCYGPAYGYSAPVYGYSYEPSYGYVYGVRAGSWRGGHRGYAWTGWHGGRGHAMPLVGAAHINGSPRGFVVAHGGAHLGGHMHGLFMH